MRSFLAYVCACYKQGEDSSDVCRIAAQAAAYIQRNLDKALRREEIAAQVHVSAGYLSRVFRKEMGMSLKEYVIEQKMQLARSMLSSTSLPVSLVAVRVGYTNFSQFSQTYRTRFGCSPSAERKNSEQGKGERQEKTN